MLKRILTLMLVMIFSAGMAYAEERLELSGQMRVQGFAIENYGVKDKDDNVIVPPFDDNTNGDEQAWFAQRFRLAAKLNVMEGVTANLRFDFAEDAWGSDNWAGARYGSGSELQVDRAYLQIDQESYLFAAGQLFQSLGNAIVVDQNTTGMTFKMKFPVSVDLYYAKLDENSAAFGARESEIFTDNGSTKDTDFYAINVGLARDKMSFNGFLAMNNDKSGADDDAPIVLGFQGATTLDTININAELDIFTGEKSSTVDYVGTQLYVDANAAVGQATVGGMFMYAMGNDKADEEQITELSDFGSFSPLSYGILDFTDWGAVEDGFGRSSFEACGDEAGVITLSGYGEMMLMEKLALRGQLAYSIPAEDKVAVLDSLILLNAGVEYELLKDLSLFLSVQYALVDSNSDLYNLEDDSPLGIASMVRLNF